MIVPLFFIVSIAEVNVPEPMILPELEMVPMLWMVPKLEMVPSELIVSI